MAKNIIIVATTGDSLPDTVDLIDEVKATVSSYGYPRLVEWVEDEELEKALKAIGLLDKLDTTV